MTRISLAATHQLPIDSFPRVQAVCFDSEAEGKFWLDDLINGEDYKREGRKLILSSGIVIDSSNLDTVLASKARAGIDDRYLRQNRQFRKGPWHEQPKEVAVPTAERKSSLPKEPRAAKPEGFLTAAEVAAQLGVTPFDVRQALRNTGAKKPEFGWAFDPKEVKAIKKLIANKS